MKRITTRVIFPVLAVLAPTGLEMSGYENMTLAIVIWCICGVLLLVGIASWVLPVLPWVIVRKRPKGNDDEFYSIGIIEVPEEIASAITDDESDSGRILELKTSRYEKRKKKDGGRHEV